MFHQKSELSHTLPELTCQFQTKETYTLFIAFSIAIKLRKPLIYPKKKDVPSRLSNVLCITVVWSFVS